MGFLKFHSSESERPRRHSLLRSIADMSARCRSVAARPRPHRGASSLRSLAGTAGTWAGTTTASSWTARAGAATASRSSPTCSSPTRSTTACRCRGSAAGCSGRRGHHGLPALHTAFWPLSRPRLPPPRTAARAHAWLRRPQTHAAPPRALDAPARTPSRVRTRSGAVPTRPAASRSGRPADPGSAPSPRRRG